MVLQGYDKKYRNSVFSVLTVSEEKLTYCLSSRE